MENREHAVLVKIGPLRGSFGDDDERREIALLEMRIEQLLASRTVGEIDGDEFGEGNCTIYLYGSNADRLAGLILPLLANSIFAACTQITKRYGPPGAPEEQLDVSLAQGSR